MKIQELAGIKYTMPDADLEYEEAMRYPSLRNLSKPEWARLVASGRKVIATSPLLAKLGNTTAATKEDAEESYGELEQEKRTRVERLLNKGTIELPIVLKDNDSFDLLSGNTRLTAMVKAGIAPVVLIVDITPEDDNEAR